MVSAFDLSVGQLSAKKQRAKLNRQKKSMAGQIELTDQIELTGLVSETCLTSMFLER